MSINLVASNKQTEIKRVLPRFPICYLTFREAGFHHVFEVVNISATGMQILLKDGKMPFHKESLITGELRWHGHELKLQGKTVWTTFSRAGIEFSMNPEIIEDFFNWERVGNNLKAVHGMDYPYDLPARLKYWVRSDGPHELHVWQYGSGAIESFSIILREKLVFWEEAQGVSTGRVISKRGVELPLSTEDEYIFLVDSISQKQLIKNALEFAQKLDNKHLPERMREFLIRKLDI